LSRVWPHFSKTGQIRLQIKQFHQSFNCCSMIRAAFDIGSGSTKIQVAKVHVSGRVEEVLFSEEKGILLGTDYEKNQDHTIGPHMENELIQAILDYKKVAEELGAKEYAAIATEVFRKAKNGANILEKIRNAIGIHPQLVSQETEGKLGFLTAVAVSGKNKQNVIAWDSGGASFQIVALIDDKINVYEGPLGSINTTKIMIEHVQKKSFNQHFSPNPTTEEEAQALVEAITNIIADPPQWLISKLQQKDMVVVPFGGVASCFTLATQILNKSIFQTEDIKQAITLTTNKTDEQFTYIQPQMVVPKLCLILAVMTKLGIETCECCCANGSTPGLLIANEFW